MPEARSHGLVLTKTHQVLLVRDGTGAEPVWRLPAVAIPPGERPLPRLAESIRALVAMPVPPPVGSRATEVAHPLGRDFAFLLEPDARLPEAEELRRNARSLGWEDAGVFPLGRVTELLTAAGEQHLWWALYCDTLLGGHRPSTRALDVFSFGAGLAMAARLAHHVLKGSKRWTTGSIPAMEQRGETIPHVGLQSLLTDGFGIPLALLETVEVRRVRFGEVAPEVAAGEGEGDLSFEDWQEGHVHYFSQEALAQGATFTNDTPVFNERFRVVKVLGTADMPE